MPGMSGLEAAQAIAEDWPDAAGALPVIVFVTAYDQYALQAFEHSAGRLRAQTGSAGAPGADLCACEGGVEGPHLTGTTPDNAAALEATLGQLRHLLGTPGLANPGRSAAARCPTRNSP